MKKSLISIMTIFCLFASQVTWALANPASVNCSRQGGQWVLIKNVGLCLFKDNSYCEEWAFMRGQCQPGLLKFPGNYSAKNLKTYCITKSNGQTKVITCKSQ